MQVELVEQLFEGGVLMLQPKSDSLKASVKSAKLHKVMAVKLKQKKKKKKVKPTINA